jgi:hypothetical protein
MRMSCTCTCCCCCCCCCRHGGCMATTVGAALEELPPPKQWLLTFSAHCNRRTSR